jgi:peroxiredoxin (alkyl hydroperoxide reductase subunit C)
MIGVGEEFPFFELNGVNGDKEIISATLDDYDGWKIIYFYPKDFTFICPTEIAGFDSINVDADIIGISGDNEFCKLAWRESNDLIADCTHDLLADCGLVLADELEIVDNAEKVALRATYIVDEDNYIQHVSVNALDTGRNHEEIERTINALQAGGLTGCQWEAGDDFVA